MQKPIRIEIPTLFAMGTVNAYLFTEPEPVLVDCGEKTEASWQALLDGLQKEGLAVEDIKKIVLTHTHVDHLGQALKIVQRSGAKIWVSQYAYSEVISLNQNWDQRLSIMRETLEMAGVPKDVLQKRIQGMGSLANFWDEIPPDYIHTFQDDEPIAMGGSEWEVIYTPGHSIKQTCFYQSELKSLISADMLLYITPTPVIEANPENPQLRNKGLPQMLESYAKLRALDIEDCFPGHGVPFVQHQALIDRQVKRIHQRKEELFSHVQSGEEILYKIAQVMYKDTAPPLRPLGLIMSIGYLDLLLDEERVACELQDHIQHLHVKK
ncbi:MAG: MBL fold metallo-hydrolase [Bacteroidota bacterium]